ncbi:hypothetical protein VNO77_22824 [Canavalia gladiata]|uniref:Uncharacterized protein n=1 Tax=Canavalia gladiata TaxID=3824 RepID=A0AAN9L3H3_CANGL
MLHSVLRPGIATLSYKPCVQAGNHMVCQRTSAMMIHCRGGIVAIIFLAFLTNISLEILLGFSGVAKASIHGEVMNHAFGRSGKPLLQIPILVNNFSLLVVYMITTGAYCLERLQMEVIILGYLKDGLVRADGLPVLVATA